MIDSGAEFQARFEVPQGATERLMTDLDEVAPLESRTVSAAW